MWCELVDTLTAVSERAARIARAVRREEALLSLLTQEKKGSDKNPRFYRDFKTLADVLVQQVIRHHIEAEFPGLRGKVLGEESNTLELESGSFTVEVKESEDETFQLLKAVLGNEVPAKLLSREVHSTIALTGGSGTYTEQDEPSPTDSKLAGIDPSLSLPSHLAIWIDPIDSTSEYIEGKDGSELEGLGMCKEGLQCVTVLVGVFDLATGAPVLGVVNQPFYTKTSTTGWVGRWFCGISYGDLRLMQPTMDLDSTNSKKVVVSRIESEEVVERLKRGGYEVVGVAGAGHKCLAVVLGCACAYVCTPGTLYPWDTCAPHSLLLSLGGGIVDSTSYQPIVYSDSPSPHSNGLIAYRHPSTLHHIRQLLTY